MRFLGVHRTREIWCKELKGQREFHTEGIADAQPPMKPIGLTFVVSTTSSNGQKCSDKYPKGSANRAWHGWCWYYSEGGK